MVSACRLLFCCCDGRLSGGFFLVTAHEVVVDESTTLRGLGREVCDVTAEQEHVSRLDLPREPHEHKGVHAKSWNYKRGRVNRHFQGYVRPPPLTESHLPADDSGIFSNIRQGCEWDAPIGHRAPKVGAKEQEEEEGQGQGLV